MSVAWLGLASCAAVYAVVALSFAKLSSVRRLGSEYTYFALLSFGFCLACIGGLRILDAESTAAAAVGQQLEGIGTFIAFAAFTAFAYANAARPVSSWGRLAIAFGIGGVAATAGGAMIDPNVTLDAASAIGPGSYPHAGSTVFGKVSSLAGTLACGAVVYDVGDNIRRTREGRTLLVMSVLAMVVWTGRTALDISDVALGPVFGASVMPFVASLAMTLFRRWVDVDLEIAQRNDQLEASVQRLAEAQTELVKREQLAAVGELSAVIAHEVRNPLAVLKNAVSGLRRDNLSDELRTTLHGILDEETDRLNRLVRDLLAYARPIHMTHDDVDLRAIVERVVATAREARSGTNIEVDLRLDVPATVRGDGDQLERALMQLVENALDAMPSGGRLLVEGTKRTDGGTAHVAVGIHDSGEGMDTLVRSRAKEPFFTTRKQGTGLGLAIVERVAAAHGGRLELGRNPDGGTSATFVFPCSERRTTPERGRTSLNAPR